MPPFRKPHSRRGGRSTRRGRFCTPAVSRRHRAPRVPPARTLPSRSRRPNRSVSLRSRPVSLGTGNSRRRHRGCSSGGAPCRHGPRPGLASTPPVASGRAGRRALRRRRVGHRAPRPRTQPGRATALTRSPAVACARAMCRAERVAPARGSPLGLSWDFRPYQPERACTRSTTHDSRTAQVTALAGLSPGHLSNGCRRTPSGPRFSGQVGVRRHLRDVSGTCPGHFSDRLNAASSAAPSRTAVAASRGSRCRGRRCRRAADATGRGRGASGSSAP